MFCYAFEQGLEEPVIISWDGGSPCQAHHVPKWTGPVLWYSTCLQVQNPKPNDRLSVGHSRSKGELRERERERILLHRGGCLGLLFDSEHGVFGHFCGIIFFQWHLWQLVKMARLGRQWRKMPEKRYSITRKGRRRGSMTSQSPGTRLTLTTGSWSALIPAGMRVECSKKAPSQLCSHSTEVLSLSLLCSGMQCGGNRQTRELYAFWIVPLFLKNCNALALVLTTTSRVRCLVLIGT